MRRNPRDGILVAALVALPSAALMLISTVAASQQATVDETLAAELGQAEAWVMVGDPTGAGVVQSPTDARYYEPANGAASAPQSDATSLTASDVEALLPDGARVVALQQGAVVVSTGDAATRTTAVQGGAWDPALTGIYHVVSGAVPNADTEVMVTATLADTLRVGVGDTVAVEGVDGPLTVSGVLAGRVDSPEGTIFTATGAIDLGGDIQSTTWYDTNVAMSWDQVRALNAHGLIAYSRRVALDPPPDPALTPYKQPVAPTLVAAGAVGLVAALLLAGAGFVVTFRRQRHHLALLAATGATRGTLAAVGIARGCWLGLAGGVAGVVLGLAGGFAWVSVLLRWGGVDARTSTWGYHVTWWHAGIVVAYGVTVGMLASLVPALMAARLDVIAVLGGTRRATRPHRWPTIVGALAGVVGVFALVRAAHTFDASLDLVGVPAYDAATTASRLLAAGSLIVFTGAVFLVPAVLRGLSRIAFRASLGLRIAARDATRNLGRTVPVIAAIAITVAIGSAVLMTLDRDQHYLADRWVPIAPKGDGVVALAPGRPDANFDASAAAKAVRVALPDANVTVIDGWQFEIPDMTGTTAVPSIIVPEANLCPYGDQTERERAADPRCAGAASNLGPWVFQVDVGGVDALRALLVGEPTTAAKDTLNHGGVVVFSNAMLNADKVKIGLWDYAHDNFPDQGVEPSATMQLPAVYQQYPYGERRAAMAVLSPAAAAAIGWPVVPTTLIVDATKPIDSTQAAAVNRALQTVAGSGFLWLDVENGPREQEALFTGALAILGVALLIITATTIALALARSDARRDDFTLASLGASPRTAKAITAWQGALIVGSATTIGLATALAWTWANNHALAQRGYTTPWLWIIAGWVALPAITGALSWLLTRAARAIHYRLAA
ncbi:ABC transporter permease [Demequina lutea]|uniref:ABC transport system permease protein n=1 Tax=Demequina lutea TaxID=431489 RepID=A0A7Y9ZDT7_9MICO|nr:ABC transporter permease [Demequina lutea]NYI42413.1 hypothetical protein [Demequina lutea]